MTTNIPTYFTNKPLRGVGGKPASLPFGDKFDISIAACAEGPRPISMAYITFHIILARPNGRRGVTWGKMRQNAALSPLR